jgi:subtilisin family serine protease
LAQTRRGSRRSCGVLLPPGGRPTALQPFAERSIRVLEPPPGGFAAATAVAAILVLSPVLPAAASLGQSDRHASAAERDGTDVVTLITGDVVRVTHLAGGRSAAAVEQPGTSGGVQILTVGRDLYAIPDAARPYLAAGRLDRQLFNVTELIEQGYDDASADGLPLIAEYAGKQGSQAARRAPVGADKVRDLGSINAAALTTDDADRFWDVLTPDAAAPTSLSARFTNGIAKIWLDQKVEADLSDSVPQVGAPAAWAAGFDGTGADVAVLDTGADATHPDLAGRIRGSVSFVPDDDTGDENGHGTHVASTIAGSGAASGGANRGVAPGAELLIGKVLEDFGSGQDSWVIDGMEWAAQHADVVNMSLGSPIPTDGTDPLSQAVDG